MRPLKTALLCLLIISQTGCNNDNTTEGSNSNKSDENLNNSPKAVQNKVNVSVEIVGDGKDWMGLDGCQTKFVYNSAMDVDVSVHVVRYEVIHTKEKTLKTGLASKRTIKPNETRKVDAGFSGLTCDQVTGLEIQKFSCKIKDTGVDCADNMNFVSTNEMKLTVKL